MLETSVLELHAIITQPSSVNTLREKRRRQYCLPRPDGITRGSPVGWALTHVRRSVKSKVASGTWRSGSYPVSQLPGSPRTDQQARLPEQHEEEQRWETSL